MRLRFTVLATVLAALASAAVPAAAGAAPQHNRGLTIHAVPHNIIAGEAVLIYGQLQGPGHGNQVIHLYHRINPRPFFTLIGTTRTNANGQYEFVRPEGIVESNRSWFVRGPFFTHSRTVHERVAALVSLAASSASGVTRQPIIFSGHVTPDHAGETVLLQSEVTTGTGNQFKTLKRVRIGPGSNFQAPVSFRVPGAYSIRAYFPGDGRNTSAPSDLVAVVIQQAQTPDFTIQTSDPIVTNGSMYTISGTLYAAGTTTPEPNTSVSLFARRPQGGPFKEITTTTTASDGTYSFSNQESTTNELYQVRTTFPPARNTATLFEGVQDVVTMSSSSSTSTVGGHITFSGDVSPDKAGHVIYLQRLGKDGNWHTVEVRFVNASSTFQFGWTFGTAGVKQFRAQIDGGPANVGGASGPVTVDVTQPALNQLPTL
jgi:hypothetical protein